MISRGYKVTTNLIPDVVTQEPSTVEEVSVTLPEQQDDVNPELSLSLHLDEAEEETVETAEAMELDEVNENSEHSDLNNSFDMEDNVERVAGVGRRKLRSRKEENIPSSPVLR